MHRLQARRLELKLRHPFQLARGPASETRETVLLQLGEAVGEATPLRYLGESAAAIVAALDEFGEAEADAPSAIDSVLERFTARWPHLRAARAGLDFALHDLVGRRHGMPVYRLYGLDPAAAPATSFTIGMAPPDLLRRKVEEATPYSILKVKLGSPDDWETLRLIRSLTDKPIRVDANEGWAPAQAVAMTRRLPDFDVECVEQPVPRDDLDGLARVTEASPLPVIADESCQHLPDIARLAGRVHGLNIKLMKCGGIRQGLKMIEAARALGMKVMLGCMIETSVGITAAAHLSPLVDYADLDGNLLITNDPFEGVQVVEGTLKLPAAPGLGVRPRTG